MPENKNTLNVRLSLKYDSYENWSTRNPVLLKGEVAFTTVPEGDTNNISKSLPAVLAKVGDGEHAYNDLPFVTAKSADVSEWAKANVKPEYTATEIAGLEDYIKERSDIDTDTQYKIVKVTDYQYKLMSKALGATEFTDVPDAVINIPQFDDSAIISRLAAIDGEEGTVAKIDERLTTAESEIDTLQNKIGGLNGAMHFKGVVDVDPTTITEGYVSGDVVLFNKKEYVFDETQGKFIELGDEGSLVTRDELTDTADALKTELKTYADTAEQDALTAAQTYTNEQIAALKTDLILNCGDSNIVVAENTDPQA